MWTRIYVWTEKTARKMTTGKTKILWADTIKIYLQDMFGWEVDETDLGPYSDTVSDILINSAECLVSYNKELISTAKFWRSKGKTGPPLLSSGQSFWLQIQRSRVRFPALPNFLSSSGSGTGSTQPREVN